MSKIQAIILAGGQGSRLRPYTTVLPKPLLPVGEFPIAEIIIRQLKNFGIKNIAISTGHLAELIEAYFGKGKKWGVSIRYVRENEPLGTAGAIRLVRDMQDNCIVINGDILTDINFDGLIRYHRRKRGIATIAVKERIVKTDFGVIKLHSSGKLYDYIEKPEYKSFVSMGLYVINRKCKEYLLPGRFMGMPDLMLTMKGRGEAVYCFKNQGTWLDLGRFDDFELAQEVFLKNKRHFLRS